VVAKPDTQLVSKPADSFIRGGDAPPVAIAADDRALRKFLDVVWQVPEGSGLAIPRWSGR
jgi:hypothetical protein